MSLRYKTDTVSHCVFVYISRPAVGHGQSFIMLGCRLGHDVKSGGSRGLIVIRPWGTKIDGPFINRRQGHPSSSESISCLSLSVPLQEPVSCMKLIGANKVNATFN